MVKKIIKILLYTITGFIAVVLLLIFLAGAGYLNGLIARQVSKQAGKSINGELIIGSISGKLFSHFIIHDIILLTGSDTLMKCRSIELEYDPGQLLHENLELNLIRVDDLSFNVKQETDSSWNFMKIIKESNEESDTSKNASSWKINLDEFRLKNLSARISALDTGMIPSTLEGDLRMKGSFSAGKIVAEIDSLRMKTENPEFRLMNLSSTFRKEGNMIYWENLKVALNQTVADSRGSFNIVTDSIDASLSFSPLAFEDFASLLKGIKLYGHPGIVAEISGSPEKYKFSLGVEEKDQKIDFSGDLMNAGNDTSYSAEIIVSNLNGSSWTHEGSMKTDISGKLEISGKGFDIKGNSMTLNGKFGNISYGGYNVKDVIFNVLKKSDQLSGRLSAGTYAGNADIGFILSDVFDNPWYDLNAVYGHVDIGKFPGADSLNSDLNGSIVIKGKGISPDRLKARISMKSFNSEINNQRIDDFGLDADYDKGMYNFSIPGIETPFFKIEANGHGNVKSQNNISFSFEPFDLYSLLRSFGMPDARLSGKISGDVTGVTDSLKAKLYIDLADISYDSMNVQNLKANVDAFLMGKSYSGAVQLTSDSIRYGRYSLKSAGLNAVLQGNNLSADLQVNVSDSLSAAFKGKIEGFEDPLIRINNLAINFMGSTWESITDSSSVKLDKDVVYINDFGMSSGDQDLKITGKFAFRGDEDLTLDIDNLELQSLPLQSILPYDVSGTLSTHFSLRGTSFAPVIDARLSADSLSLNEYKTDSIRLRMNYDKEMFSASGSIDFGQQEPLTINARLPVRLSLNDSITVLKDQPGLFASVKLDSLDLNELSALVPVTGFSFSGSASAEAEVSNTINDPVIKGSLDVRDGRFRNREFGIDYRNIRLSALVDSDRLKIDEFVAGSGKGNINMKGSINLNSRDSLNAKDVSVNLKASDFQAMKSGTAELNFNSDIGITGSFVKPEMKGKVTINSSKLNVDYFTSKFSRIKDEPNPPLLEQALRDTVNIEIPPDTSSAGIPGASLFRNLSGELLIDIPGNTWVTGKDMNFEIEGTMRVVKSSPHISLFGDLNVRRGYYKIYGRKFEFNKGNITFTGGSEFNPALDMEIVYRFRDIEKNMRDLKLGISGKLLQPQYTFMLDNEAIEEKDAISYIAFGKSINQLGEGEKEKMSGQDIALGAAVTQLSSVLKGVLQEEAGVDVFEFTGGEDWKSGSVTIGKYITNKLYLSYDRNFDFDKQRKTSVAEKIMLEYQIFRNLILKATNQDVNSGFDLIFKKTWK